MDIKNTNISTQCVQAGYLPKGSAEPRVMPIVQSTTYKYENCDALAAAFDLQAPTPIYTRLGNPTLSFLEEKITTLEGGIAAVTTASGQSAILFSVLALTKSGENIISLNNIYGGTHTLFASTLKNMGIEVRFVSASATADEIYSLIDDNTKLVYAETIGNPALEVLDFEKLSSIAKKADIPLVIDNTFATPYLCRPFELGANIVIHSTTKYMDGHATSVGGVIVDGGNFNWENGKFPQLSTPDESYHGLIYTKAFGKAAFALKIRAGLLRDIGSTMSPFNAFLTTLGLETLHLRMEKHCENALKVAKYLEGHEKIEFVNYPLLESSPSYELAKKYLTKGASGVVAFGVKGGSDNAKAFIDNMKLATLVTHVADVRTHALHPASTTHRQLSEAEQIAGGILPNLVRYSVGIEDADDIIADIKQALEKIK